MPEVQEPLLEQAQAQRRVDGQRRDSRALTAAATRTIPVLIDLEADVDVSLCGVVTRSRKEMADPDR